MYLTTIIKYHVRSIRLLSFEDTEHRVYKLFIRIYTKITISTATLATSLYGALRRSTSLYVTSQHYPTPDVRRYL